jgi:hypothetical protein
LRLSVFNWVGVEPIVLDVESAAVLIQGVEAHWSALGSPATCVSGWADCISVKPSHNILSGERTTRLLTLVSNNSDSIGFPVNGLMGRGGSTSPFCFRESLGCRQYRIVSTS